MNLFHLRKGKPGDLYALLFGQIHGLSIAEQQLVRRAYITALTIVLMLIAAQSVYYVEQAKLKNIEINYQSQLDEKGKLTQSIAKNLYSTQSQLDEVSAEMDESVIYISSVQGKLDEVINERDEAWNYIQSLHKKLPKEIEKWEVAHSRNNTSHNNVNLLHDSTMPCPFKFTLMIRNS